MSALAPGTDSAWSNWTGRLTCNRYAIMIFMRLHKGVQCTALSWYCHQVVFGREIKEWGRAVCQSRRSGMLVNECQCFSWRWTQSASVTSPYQGGDHIG